MAQVIETMDDVATTVCQFSFATDSEHGVITARDFDEAIDRLREMLADADGGWGWVQDLDGNRFEIDE